MDERDALGRRRAATQNRGLRPLFPRLPAGMRSRLIRVAMAAAAWERLDALVAQAGAPTGPRAYGELLERWLDLEGAERPEPVTAPAEPTVPKTIGTDWQDWQIRKELALLAATRRPEPSGASVH